jgi:PEP-CTERM motif
MYLRKLAIAGALAIASTGVLANDVTNDIVVDGGTTFFGALHTDNADFTDIFNFINVAGPVTANASLVTIGAGLNNIDFLSASLNGQPLTLSATGFFETGSIGDIDLTGPLVLTVTGKSGAAGGTFASYSGTVNVAAIPEPGTWAMLLAGVMGIAAIARRRLSV